jgi:uncharacterized membrane protein (UPF0182 family)
MEPYYVLTKLPSDEAAEFQILQPFVPRSSNDSRRNLTAFMVAKNDPGSYGKLEAYVMPSNTQVAGPLLIASEMQSDPTVSAQESLLSRGGSRVLRGNIVMLPIGDSIIAVRPMYVQAASQNAFPQLRKVVVWDANRVRMGDSLEDALRLLFGDAPPTQEGQPGEQPRPSSETVADLLAKAEAAFAAADEALRDGDLAGYQRNVSEARQYIEQAQEAERRDEPNGSTSA